MELKKNEEIRDGILYDKDNNIKIAQIEFEEVQVDTLSYMSLTDKVLKMLNGKIEFKADDSIDLDYDEPASNSWDLVDEESLDIEPFDEYSDRVDLIDTQKELIKKVEATKIIESANTQEEANIVQSKEESKQNTAKEEIVSQS